MLSKSKVRSDFSNGNHGAIKLTKEQLGHIDDFAKSVSARKLSDGEYDKLVANSADQLVFLVEGKATKKVGKTNFKDLKSLFDSIKACGYFQTERAEEEEKTGGKHGKGKKAAEAHAATNGEKKEEAKVVEAPAPIAAVPEPEPVKEIVPVQVPIPAEPQFVDLHQQQQHQQQPREAFINPHSHEQHHEQLQQVLPPQPPPQQIDFFQDSQIDMASPHMDPAVVMVHHAPPPPHMMMQQQQQANAAIASQTYTNQMYIPPTTLAMQQQQHHEHMMNFANQQQQHQQQQQPIPQPQEQQQQQHFDYQEEQTLANRIGQVGLSYPEGEAEPSKDHGFEAGTRDAMANIDEWENDQAGNNGNGNEDFNRTGSWRGGNRGRGGRGGSGGYRGERRGEKIRFFYFSDYLYYSFSYEEG